MKKTENTNSYHLRKVIAEGWMSYKEPITFHFNDLNFIIGPNNSGKSNLIKLLLFSRKFVEKATLFRKSTIHEDEIDIHIDDIFNKYSNIKSIILSFETTIDWVSGLSMLEIHVKRQSANKLIYISAIKLINDGELFVEIVNQSHIKINVNTLFNMIKSSYKFNKKADDYFNIRKHFSNISLNNISDFDKTTIDSIHNKIDIYNLKYNENIELDDILDYTDYFADMIVSSGIGFHLPKKIDIPMVSFNATKYVKSLNFINEFNRSESNTFEFLYFNNDLISLLLDSNNIVFYKVKPHNNIKKIFRTLSSSSINYTKPKLPIDVLYIIQDQILAAINIPVDSISHFTFIGSSPHEFALNNEKLKRIKQVLLNPKYSGIQYILDKYLPIMGIGEKIKIVKLNQLYEIHVSRSGKWIHERLLGAGARKMLYLILEIGYHGAIRLNKDTFKSIKEKGLFIDTISRHKILLEEPEANLHPGLQSKLAELIVESNREFKIQFIVETHSEYMIRKLQYLVANGDCESKNIQIFYLNFDPDKKTTVKRDIQITEKGTLNKPFGPGFFDEADKLSLDLFLLSGGNDN